MVEQIGPREVSRSELIGNTFFFDGLVDTRPFVTTAASGPRLNFTLRLQAGKKSYYNIRVFVDQENLHNYVLANAAPGRNVALLGEFIDRNMRSTDGLHRAHKLVVGAQSIRFG